MWHKFEDYATNPPTLEEFMKCVPLAVPLTEEQKERCYHYYNSRGWVNVRNLSSAISNWAAWQRDREARYARMQSQQQPQPYQRPQSQSIPSTNQAQPNQKGKVLRTLRTRFERYFGKTEAELLKEAQG